MDRGIADRPEGADRCWLSRAGTQSQEGCKQSEPAEATAGDCRGQAASTGNSVSDPVLKTFLGRERPPCPHSCSRPGQRAGKEGEDLTSSSVAGRHRRAMLLLLLQWRRCVCRAAVPGDPAAPQAGISIQPEITSAHLPFAIPCQ